MLLLPDLDSCELVPDEIEVRRTFVASNWGRTMGMTRCLHYNFSLFLKSVAGRDT